MGSYSQSVLVHLCYSFLLTPFPCSRMGPLHQVAFLQEKTCSSMVLSMGCREVLAAFWSHSWLAPAPGAHPPPPSLTRVYTLLLHILFFFFSHFSSACHCIVPSKRFSQDHHQHGEGLSCVLQWVHWNQLKSAQVSTWPPLAGATLQHSNANTLPWTPTTPQSSLILEVKLPLLFKDFGLIFEATENSTCHFNKRI